MKKVLYGFFILVFAGGINSCDTLDLPEDVLDGLSSEEIIEGLKTALKVGADSSTTILNARDGYYKDQAVKILLPPEAQPLVDNLEKIQDVVGLLSLVPGVNIPANDYVEETILSLNRAAEEASSEAKPIFVDAITTMSVEDGLNILNGISSTKNDFDSIAATNYLHAKTFTNLTELYAPKIDVVLDKTLISTKGDFSTNELWAKLIKYYNAVVAGCKLAETFGSSNEVILKFANESPIDTNLTLGEFATEKALTGLFMKVGDEEKKIRNNPFEWALDILEKVFGSVYVETPAEG